jgi:hypothetical protein
LIIECRGFRAGILYRSFRGEARKIGDFFSKSTGFSLFAGRREAFRARGAAYLSLVRTRLRFRIQDVIVFRGRNAQFSDLKWRIIADRLFKAPSPVLNLQSRRTGILDISMNSQAWTKSTGFCSLLSTGSTKGKGSLRKEEVTDTGTLIIWPILEDPLGKGGLYFATEESIRNPWPSRNFRYSVGNFRFGAA